MQNTNASHGQHCHAAWLSAAALLLAACSAVHDVSEPTTASATPVQVGDEVQITLDANPTTGYVWELTELDTNRLAQLGLFDYNTDTEQQGLYGAPVKMTARFKAIAPGTATVTLVYRRPFETNTPAHVVQRTIAITP
jgi:inhibitor of cysteine peptidase